MTVDRTVEEYRRIAFADIRDVAQIVDGVVALTDTSELTPIQAASIAEIQETKTGVRVRMHSKIAALEALAKWQGMFVDRSEVKLAGAPEWRAKITLVQPDGSTEETEREVYE